MMDPITISALVVSSITAVSTFITALHLRKVKLCCCITSECSTKSVPGTPKVNEKEPLLQ
jgi:hypothetical protein